MKVLILAGGFGTRLSEETVLKPKPMVEIGDKPILWHIMKSYSFYGFNEFVILGGYKSYIIKEYFANYFLHNSDITIDMQNKSVAYHKNDSEPWKVTIIDTGIETMTGGRIKRAKPYIDNEPFLLTYGDGVSDIDINKLINFHINHGKHLTMTTVQPEGRFGSVQVDSNNKVVSFKEKPKGDGNWINAGFFVCNPEILDYIDNDSTIFEQEPLERIAEAENLYTYKHEGFWKPMDTLRDKNQLERLLEEKRAPWVKW